MQILLAAWILIAPGIWAEPDEVVGQAAFDLCQAQVEPELVGPFGSRNCEGKRDDAIRTDAEARFKLLFADLAAGRIRSQATLLTYLAKYKLHQK